MLFALFVSLFVSLFSTTANAESIAHSQTTHEEYLFGAVSSMTIKTMPITDHNAANISACLADTRTSNSKNACILLLKDNACRSELLSLTQSPTRSRARTRRKQNTCFKAYCNTFDTTAHTRVCQTPLHKKLLNERIDFYATALRQYFLHTNDIEGLVYSEAIASSIIWTLRR